MKDEINTKLLYKIAVFMFSPANFILTTLARRNYYVNSVLHISFMVHVPYYTVNILRRHGVKADYMAIGAKSPVWNSCDYHVIFSKNSFVRAFQEFVWFWGVVARYEIVHSHFAIMLTDSGWELPLLKKMNRKIVVHYRGCHIRGRERNMRLHHDNDYNICHECDYNGQSCAGDSVVRQRNLGEKFKDLCFATTPDLLDFAPDAILLPLFAPEIRSANSAANNGNGKVTVAHVTAHPGIEGTNRIKEAIESLVKQGYNIEFKFLHFAHHDEVLKTFASADLAIGKMKMGYYANAQIESMSLGIPTITYVRPEFMTSELQNSGFIFTDLKNLEKTIKYYLDNRDALQAKRTIARESILKIHNNEEIAKQLVNYYERLRNS